MKKAKNLYKKFCFDEFEESEPKDKEIPISEEALINNMDIEEMADRNHEEEIDDPKE